MEQVFKTQSLTELEVVAGEIINAARMLPRGVAVVVTLSGDLGAGKTALTKVIASQLGVAETVGSPTFVVMRAYDTTDTDFTRLYHMDAYRIESETELVPLRFRELLSESHVLICIEWPEHIVSVIPSPHIAVSVVLLPDMTHQFTISYHG